MNFTLQLLLLAATTAVFTAAMTCQKMIQDKNPSNGNVGITDDIMEMGQYVVRTNVRTDSVELQTLISTLDGASDIRYKHKSFTAVLQPRDLKKVIVNSLCSVLTTDTYVCRYHT